MPTRHARDRAVNPLTLVRTSARHYEGPFADGPSKLGLPPERKILRQLAFCCWERSSLLDGVEASRSADALVALSAHWRDWLRPLDDWRPTPGDPASQLGSLLRHLLARYDVPRFLDSAWRLGLSPEGVRQQRWFRLVAQGENIRSAADLPLPLTRKMAHHFLQAPPDFDVPAAFRYAQVVGLGGSEGLTRSLLRTRLGTDFRDNDFWETVIRWLIGHPGLDPGQHGPILDYLHDQKFVPSLPSGLGRGRPRLVVPQPGLCMHGRTPESLLRAVEQWHRSLRWRRIAATSWGPSGIPPFLGSLPEDEVPRAYAVTELLSTEELKEEGLAMGHCVATYWPFCRSGEVSIWSLTAEDSDGTVERLLTLEVRGRRGQIVQARGKYNRPPDPRELHVLALWAQGGGPAPPAFG